MKINVINIILVLVTSALIFGGYSILSFKEPKIIVPNDLKPDMFQLALLTIPIKIYNPNWYSLTLDSIYLNLKVENETMLTLTNTQVENLSQKDTSEINLEANLEFMNILKVKMLKFTNKKMKVRLYSRAYIGFMGLPPFKKVEQELITEEEQALFWDALKM